MNWKAIARSAIGTSHQKQQMSCQDYGGYKIINNALIGAVADGAGSARYSDIGAKLAVKTVLETITAQELATVAELWDSNSIEETESHNNLVGKLWNILNKTEENSNGFIAVVQSLSEPKVRKFFTNIIDRVVIALKEQAAKENYPLEDLACTLLIVIATPDGVVAMQIGDGFITVRYPEESPQLLFPPDKGEYINETTFVTSTNALKDMRVVVQPGQPEFICASTDGLERLVVI